MKRLLTISVLMLLLGCMSTFAGAYIFAASATGTSSSYTSVIFGTAWSPQNIILPEIPAGTVGLAIVADEPVSHYYYRLVTSEDPDSWKLAIWGSGYALQGTTLTVTVNSPGTSSTPAGIITGQSWQFRSATETLWTGKIPSSGTLLQLYLPVNASSPNTAEIYTLERGTPEPASIAALLSGCIGLAATIIRRKG